MALYDDVVWHIEVKQLTHLAISALLPSFGPDSKGAFIAHASCYHLGVLLDGELMTHWI